MAKVQISPVYRFNLFALRQSHVAKPRIAGVDLAKRSLNLYAC